MNLRTYFEDIDAWPVHQPSGHSKPRSAVPAYVIGFALSLACVFGAYRLVVDPLWVLSVSQILWGLVGLACAQFVVQLLCFFHLGTNAKSRDRSIILVCTLLVVTILVAGSVWVMFSLNARMMPSAAQMEKYMSTQPGL